MPLTTTRVDEAARLPVVPVDAPLYMRDLDRSLHWLIRNFSQRFWALETTTGIAPRKPGGLINSTLARNIVTETAASRTVTATDTHIICNRAGTITLTLPSAATYKYRELTVRTITANTVVSASSNVIPLAGGAAGTAILAATAGKWAWLISDGTNWTIQAAN